MAEQRITPAKARLHPTPEGQGWSTIRHLANSRVPITERRIAQMTRVPTSKVHRMMEDAEKMGWFQRTEGGWQGRL